MDKDETREVVTDFIPYLKGVIDQLKADKKYPAVHTYTATMNSITECAGEKEYVVTVEEVYTKGRLKEYQEWLRQRKASWNTVSTYMRTLKAVRNRLVLAKRVDYAPDLFEDVYTKVESQTKRALSEEQERVLMTTDIESVPKNVQCALAYCLLMFYFRGMPFIDLAYLRKQDIKNGHIVYCRHKTGRQMVVRIRPEAAILLEKFKNKDSESGYLFPILNEEIEDDSQLYQYYLHVLSKFNRKLKKLSDLLLGGIRVSSYTPRHTWATLAFYQGTPIGKISKALGHSSIKVTETYLRPFENEQIDMVNDGLILSVLRSTEEKKVA